MDVRLEVGGVRDTGRKMAYRFVWDGIQDAQRVFFIGQLPFLESTGWMWGNRMHWGLCFVVERGAGHIHTWGEIPPHHVHDRAFGSGRWGEGRASPPCHGTGWLACRGAMEHDTGWGKRGTSVSMKRA